MGILILKKQNLLAITLAIVLISFGPAYAAEIPCRDLETANADELLATVDPQSIQYGGGVRLGKSGCDLYPGQKVCEWEQTHEDDQMLDPDRRLIYVLSSHQTGSGSWQNLLVFGCVSGQVKKVFLGQVGPDTSKEEVFASAPLALRSGLMEYMNHLRTISPIDCEQSDDGTPDGQECRRGCQRHECSDGQCGTLPRGHLQGVRSRHD